MMFNKKSYRRIVIAQSRDWFSAAASQYDPAIDLVLTLDLGLYTQIQQQGGDVAYLDHLLDADTMQANNYLTYGYFQRWHFDEQGNDLFQYRDIPFGFALRVDIWNDLLCYIRFRLCLAKIATIAHTQLLISTNIPVLLEALHATKLPFQTLAKPAQQQQPTYFFPIFQWMNERVRSAHWKVLLRAWLTAALGTFRSWLDRLPSAGQRINVYVQEYHPTRRLAEQLRRDPRLRVVQGHYRAAAGWRGLFAEHVIPIWPTSWCFNREAEHLLRAIEERSAARLLLDDGCDITAEVQALIIRRLHSRLANAINELHWVNRYLDRHPLALVILVGNLGPVATMVHRAAEQLDIPSFMIINGYLGKAYQDESRHATWINAYSESIRSHYFEGMNNVECLGDPRMDDYAACPSRTLNRNRPTITIGASGFNPTDLNSYLAVEFDFLWDILCACRQIVARGQQVTVLIKVRSNGYRTQYAAFVAEYFPDLACQIEDTVPIRAILEKTDFYISIYSQTLFEASCLGIPVVYYQKDNEITDPPFDGASELVTAQTPNALIAAFDAFIRGDACFSSFGNQTTMERYIGFLDGHNFKRNLKSIYRQLNLNHQDPADV